MKTGRAASRLHFGNNADAKANERKNPHRPLRPSPPKKTFLPKDGSATSAKNSKPWPPCAYARAKRRMCACKVGPFCMLSRTFTP